MKRKLLLTGLFTILIGIGAFAQRQQISMDYTNCTMNEMPFNMSGKMTYSYIVGEDGKHIKDGALSINCKINDKVEGWTNKGYEVVTIVGQSTTNATYKNGAINGAINSNYKANLSSATKKEIATASMSGNFLNGVPNGNFVVKRNAALKTSLNANYKNGVLVGAYSCSLLDDNSLVAKYSGTLSQSGKLIGEWDLNGAKAVFQNNILISIAKDGISTRPTVVEFAKKYAAGTITKEQLAEKNIIVHETSLDLGDYARVAIFRDSSIDFKDIGGYDFTISNNLTYEYLEELRSLTEEGAHILTQQIASHLKDEYIEQSELIYDPSARADKYGVLAYDDEYNRYCIFMSKYYNSKYMNSKYVVGSFMNHNGCQEVYISQKQMEVIDELAEPIFVERAQNLTEIIRKYIQKSSHPYKYISIQYLEGDRGNNSTKDLMNIYTGINDAYQVYLKDAIPHKTNDSVVLWQWNENEPISYIVKSTEADIETVLSDISEEIAKIEMEAINKIATYMITEKTAFNISYGNNESFFYTETGVSYWRSVLEKGIKPFCPLTKFEIVEIKENSIVCNLERTHKKQGVSTYQLEIKYNNRMLCVESFDINKATKIE